MDQDTQNKETHSQQIIWMKLAVAFAIIRNKPPDLTIRVYVEKLQNEFWISQFKLHERYQQSRMQIVQLKEKLAVHLLQNQVSSSAPQINDVVHHCNSMSQEHSKDMGLQAHINVDLLTPPPSAEARGLKTLDCEGKKATNLTELDIVNDFAGDHLSESLQFIQSLISVQGMSSQESWHQMTSSQMEQLLTLIHTMANVIDGDPFQVSEFCLCKAAENIVTILKNFQWLEDQSEFMHGVCRLVENIIKRFFHSSSEEEIPAHRGKQSLVNMLLVFMKGSTLPLKSSILESLIESWETFCQALVSSQHAGVAIDCDMFESGYYIIKCLELIMITWSNDSQIDPSMLRNAQARLETTLCQNIMSHFPLVAEAMLKVTTHVEEILRYS